MNEIVVFITAPKEEEAEKIARALVEAKLAGCVNILKNVRSIYTWEDKIEDEREVLMMVKTKKDLFGPLEQKVKGLHSYSVPEIIAVPILEGSADYLRWLRDVTD